MVVTRRPPVPPVPTSRTNSAQPIPRVKGKVPLSTTPDVSSPLSNGTTQDDTEHLDSVDHADNSHVSYALIMPCYR